MSPPLGISLGDPAGIGPEVVVRALAQRPTLNAVIFGDRGVLARTAAALGLPMPDHTRDVSRLSPEAVIAGRPNQASAEATVAYLAAATDAVMRGEIGALVTAPISKEWVARAGFEFPGHTEYLAAAAGIDDYAMMLAGPQLRVTLATIHMALRDVARVLTPETIARVVRLTARSLRDSFGISRPRVAVAGFNPHAGEAGRFGDEEARLVQPGIALATTMLERDGVAAEVTGPHVPDAVFRQAAAGGFDAVVALYHDQGLIPVKMLHFDDAVNVTLGLPFVRTSPDHGTAYDIAGTGRARPDSFLAALDLAVAMSRSRHASGAAIPSEVQRAGNLP
jgi:4-hydroxythreonine-4-phosphate dehydrogenase